LTANVNSDCLHKEWFSGTIAWKDPLFNICTLNIFFLPVVSWPSKLPKPGAFGVKLEFEIIIKELSPAKLKEIFESYILQAMRPCYAHDNRQMKFMFLSLFLCLNL